MLKFISWFNLWFHMPIAQLLENSDQVVLNLKKLLEFYLMTKQIQLKKTNLMGNYSEKGKQSSSVCLKELFVWSTTISFPNQPQPWAKLWLLCLVRIYLLPLEFQVSWQGVYFFICCLRKGKMLPGYEAITKNHGGQNVVMKKIPNWESGTLFLILYNFSGLQIPECKISTERFWVPFNSKTVSYCSRAFLKQWLRLYRLSGGEWRH